MAQDERAGNDPLDRVLWTPAGAPRSARYDDVYFSEADGLAESRHVFQSGVDLEARLRRGGLLRIGEIGLGMGLNALGAWARLDQIGAEGAAAQIAYHGIERSPPAAEAVRRALAPWPELAPYRAALLQDWPPPPGVYSRRLSARFELTALIGEAGMMIDHLKRPCDVWWLDGFSPARNPEAWAPELLAAIFERTAPGGAVATYSAAGWVRRGLQAAGFTVERRPGFGSKREMLTGRKPG